MKFIIISIFNILFYGVMYTYYVYQDFAGLLLLSIYAILLWSCQYRFSFSKDVKNKVLEYVEYLLKLLTFFCFVFVFRNISIDVSNEVAFIIVLITGIISTSLILLTYRGIDPFVRVKECFLTDKEDLADNPKKVEESVKSLVFLANTFVIAMYVILTIIDRGLIMQMLLSIFFGIVVLALSIISSLKLTTFVEPDLFNKTNVVKVPLISLVFVYALVSGIVHQGVQLDIISLIVCGVAIAVVWNVNKQTLLSLEIQK